ncbi:MAG: energy transducer TonB [Rhodanobacter sp.]|nr:energy transducer TonB [Rhodanobacter sp.]
MKRALIGLCGLCLAGSALAGPMDDRADQSQATMAVTGSIVVSQDGSVQSYLLDHPEKLPPGVVALIAKTVPSWQFQPVVMAGKASTTKAAMSLRVVARQTAKDHYTEWVGGASFGTYGSPVKSAASRVEPRYPQSAMQDGVSGEVLLAVKIDRNGSVEDVAAEQVNLFVRANVRTMWKGRHELARAAVIAVRTWTFGPQTAGIHGAYSSRIVPIPVKFCLYALGSDSHPCKDGYGEWQDYLPGPREPIPWLPEDQPIFVGAFATPGDRESGVNWFDINGLRLKTPLAGD